MTSADKLRALNAGQLPTSPVETAVPVYNPSSCALVPAPQATKDSYRINLKDLVTKVCGFMAVELDNSATNSVQVRWNLGLKDLDEGARELIQALFGIPTSPAVWASESTILFGTSKTGAIFEGNVFVPYLNNIFETEPTIFGNITFMNRGDATAFQNFKRNAFQVYELNPSGNWSTSNYDLKPDICSPCFNSNDEVVQWSSGGLPAGSTTGLSIIIPANLKGQFEFCVVGTGDQRLIEPCGA